MAGGYDLFDSANDKSSDLLLAVSGNKAGNLGIINFKELSGICSNLFWF